MNPALVANSARWRKSTRCGGSATCVEVGTWVATVGLVNKPVRYGVLLRDTADPDGPMLALTPGDWRSLLTAIKEER